MNRMMNYNKMMSDFFPAKQPNLRCNFNEEKPWQCPGKVVNTTLPSDFMVYSRFLVPGSPLLVPCVSILLVAASFRSLLLYME